MLSKIVEPLVYLAAWLYFHTKLLIAAIVKFVRFTVITRVRLSIHTFIGAGLAVFYYTLFTGHIEQFHGFHDALPMVAVYAPAARGVGFVFEMAIASVLLITLSRGVFLLLGYALIFWVYVILSAFETPKPIKVTTKVSASSVFCMQKRMMAVSYRV